MIKHRGALAARLGAAKHDGVIVAAGGLVLTLGCLVYLTDRGNSHVPILQLIPAAGGHDVFGRLGQWLPTFAHSCSFGLFTAAALPASLAMRIGACAAWCLVNVAFEIGQHPQVSPWLASSLLYVFGTGPITRSLESYFSRGTFDIGDIAAAVLGALTAMALLLVTQAVEEKRHAQ